MNKSIGVVCLSFIGAALIGCGPKVGTANQAAAFLEPTSDNFYIRKSFDTDPTRHLGKFVAFDSKGQMIPDEKAARKTECSQYISALAPIEGAGQHDEIFSASRSVALGLGLGPADMTIGASDRSNASFRVTYTHTRTFAAEPSNPAALNDCCLNNPNECNGAFISEFIEGKMGQVWKTQGAGQGVDFPNTGAKVTVEANRGYKWRSTRSFDTPVSFAFSVTPMPSCRDFVERPPQSDKWVYFSGVSKTLTTKQAATDDAYDAASKNAAKQIRMRIKISDTETTETLTKDGVSTETTRSQETVDRNVEELLSHHKLFKACPVEEKAGRPLRFQARVLTRMPREMYEKLSGTVPAE